MTASQPANQVSRDAILKILSDDEVARVSNAETTKSLPDGQEFIDLQDLERGVQRASGSNKPLMGHALPRKAVHDDSWTKVVALLRPASK